MTNRLHPTPPPTTVGEETKKACLIKKESSTHLYNFLSHIFFSSLPTLSNFSNLYKDASLDVSLKEYSLITLDCKGRLTWFLAKRLQNGHTKILKIQKEVSPFFWGKLYGSH